MSKENISGKVVDYSVLKRLFSFVKPYKFQFYVLVFLTILLGTLAPFQPLLIQYTLDNHVTVGDYQGLTLMLSILIGLLVFQAIVQYSHTYMSGWLGQYVIRDIRVKLFGHLLKLKLKFFDNTPIGRLVTRTISDIETLADVFSQGLAAIISDVLQLIFIVGIMFYTHWQLALVSLATFPLMLIATYVFKEKIKVAFNQVRNAVSNLNSFVQEHVTGMSIVQIFGSEKREFEKFKEINEEHKKANLRSVLYYSVYFPVAEIISAAGIGLLVWYGAKGVLNFEESGISLGTLIAFIMYINMFFRPIRMIADRFNTLQLGVVSTQRIINLIDSKEFIADEGKVSAESIEGQVSFENVWFAYNEEEYVLKDISFKVNKGQTIALVGATGAGKSSIINLLNRFYDINKGTISIDGQPHSDYELDGLRHHIGVVLQDVFLFSDSIKNNITLNNPSISDEEVIKAAKLVGAWKFIETFNKLEK